MMMISYLDNNINVLASVDVELSAAKNCISEEFSHFTSIASLFEILKNKTIRVSHFDFMNDPEDGRFFIKEFLNVVYDSIGGVGDQVQLWRSSLVGNRHNDYSDIEDGLSVYMKNYGAFRDDVAGIQQVVASMYQHLVSSLLAGDHICAAFYIFSASETQVESIDCWRTYADDGNGIKISFHRDEMGLDKFSFYRCLYLNKNEINEKAHAVYRDLIAEIKKYNITENNIKYFNEVLKKIMNLSVIIKREWYEGEKEIRFVNYVGNEPDVNIKFIPKKNLITKCIDYDLNINSIKEIIIGPQCHPRMERVMIDYLMKCFRGGDGRFPKVSRSFVKYVGKIL